MQGASDVGEAGETGRLILGLLVTLNLLFLQMQPSGQFLLAKAGGNACPDKTAAEFSDRADADVRGAAALELVIFRELVLQVLQLAFHRLAFGLQKARMHAGTGRCLFQVSQRRPELGRGRLGHSVLIFVGDHVASLGSIRTMPLGLPWRSC